MQAGELVILMLPNLGKFVCICISPDEKTYIKIENKLWYCISKRLLIPVSQAEIPCLICSHGWINCSFLFYDSSAQNVQSTSIVLSKKLRNKVKETVASDINCSQVLREQILNNL